MANWDDIKINRGQYGYLEKVNTLIDRLAETRDTADSYIATGKDVSFYYNQTITGISNGNTGKLILTKPTWWDEDINTLGVFGQVYHSDETYSQLNEGIVVYKDATNTYKFTVFPGRSSVAFAPISISSGHSVGDLSIMAKNNEGGSGGSDPVDISFDLVFFKVG